MRAWIHGFIAILKFKFKIGLVDEETKMARYARCSVCEKNDYGVCGECGCVLSMKVAINSESCPLKLWER